MSLSNQLSAFFFFSFNVLFISGGLLLKKKIKINKQKHMEHDLNKQREKKEKRIQRIARGVREKERAASSFIYLSNSESL